LALWEVVRKLHRPNTGSGADVDTSPGLVRWREEEAVAKREAEEVVL